MTKPAKRIGKRSIERLVRLSTRRFDPIRSDPIEKPLHRDATRRSLADSKVATQLQPAVSNEQRDRDESARLGCARESSIDFGRVYYWSTTMPQNKKKKKKEKKNDRITWRDVELWLGSRGSKGSKGSLLAGLLQVHCFVTGSPFEQIQTNRTKQKKKKNESTGRLGRKRTAVVIVTAYNMYCELVLRYSAHSVRCPAAVRARCARSNVDCRLSTAEPRATSIARGPEEPSVPRAPDPLRTPKLACRAKEALA